MAESATCQFTSPRTRFFIVADSLIDRAEVVALLFNVSDIADTLTNIEEYLKEGDGGGEEEADEG